MFGKMKELMEMKKQADKIKKELDASKIDVSVVHGITLEVNGSQSFSSISIDEAMLDPNKKKKLESDLLKSLNAAINKSQQMAAEKMKAVMPSFPGM